MQVMWLADCTLPQLGHLRITERATWHCVHSMKWGGKVELQLMQMAIGSAPGTHMLPRGGAGAAVGESLLGELMSLAWCALIRREAEDLHILQAVLRNDDRFVIRLGVGRSQ